MKIFKWSGIIGLLLITATFTVLAQTEAPLTYTADAVDWQIIAPNNYVGEPQSPSAFLNVASDEDGQIYVANFLSVLVYDGETGALADSIHDDSATVVQYDDVAPADDGNIWVADSKTYTVYLLDAQGSILQAIPSVTADNTNAKLSPNELEVGPDGNLYVLYSSASTLMQVFTAEGEFVRSFGMGDRSLSSGLIDFTFGPDGNLYIAGVGTVRVLDVEGEIIVETFAQDFLEDNSIAVRGIAVDTDGNVFIGGNSIAEDESLVAAVYEFDADGQLLAQFGTAQQRMDWGSEFKPGELGFTVSLAVLPEGQLVISDLNGAFSQLLRVDMRADDSE
jgi:outer membrane protein assembly factor BamB